MSDSNEMNLIVEDVYYKVKDDYFIFYNKSKSKLGEVKKILDEDKMILTYSDFKKESEDFSIDSLHDIFIQIIESSNILQVNQLIIKQFPLDIDTFNSAVKKILNLYSKGITISYDHYDSELIFKIQVNFKHPRITHYVQQAYLRNFSSNVSDWKNKTKNVKARIFCFDKEKGCLINIGNTKTEREKGIKINRIAYREYFYSLHLEEFMRHTLERIIPQILEKIISSKSLMNISQEEKMLLGQYIILSWLRTTETREHIRESYEKTTMEAVKMIFGEEEFKGIKVKLHENQLRRMHEDHIMRLLFPEEDPLANRLIKLEWGLIKARSPNFFLTSDTPVVFHNSYIDKHIKRKGKIFFREEKEKEREFIESKDPSAHIKLTSPNRYKRPGSEGIEIYFSLTPHLCLYLADKKPKFKPLDVKKVNKLYIIQSENLLFSRFNKLAFVNIIVKKNPDCVDKSGKRTIIQSKILDRLGDQDLKFAKIKAVKPPI
ncbi:hypothetical protein LCGC14_0991460 [marine sediment metagenome]|uniref:Uncharacterized protein n=1 Tax=marine sediment metagenome TaxID=412755 RepID=A0A0F9NS98_9ZZZZ